MCLLRGSLLRKNREDAVMKKIISVIIVALIMVGCGNKTPPEIIKKEKKQINYLKQGAEQLKKYNIKEAIMSFYQAIANDPQDVEPHLVLGGLFMKMKNYDKAIEHYKRAGELQPDNGQIFFILARCYGLKGDNEQALNNVKRSILIFKAKNDNNHYQPALILLRMLRESKKNKPSVR